MKLAQRIERSGLRDTEIAARLGTVEGTVRNWRLGHTVPQARLVADLARLLGCDPDQMMHEFRCPACGQVRPPGAREVMAAE